MLIACPACTATAEPAVVVVSGDATLAICSACGQSLAQTETTWRRATAADTTAISKADLQTLQRAHGAIARPAGRQP